MPPSHERLFAPRIWRPGRNSCHVDPRWVSVYVSLYIYVWSYCQTHLQCSNVGDCSSLSFFFCFFMWPRCTCRLVSLSCWSQRSSSTAVFIPRQCTSDPCVRTGSAKPHPGSWDRRWTWSSTCTTLHRANEVRESTFFLHSSHFLGSEFLKSVVFGTTKRHDDVSLALVNLSCLLPQSGLCLRCSLGPWRKLVHWPPLVKSTSTSQTTLRFESHIICYHQFWMISYFP